MSRGDRRGREQRTGWKGTSTCSGTLRGDGGYNDGTGGDDGCSGLGEYDDTNERIAGTAAWTMVMMA